MPIQTRSIAHKLFISGLLAALALPTLAQKPMPTPQTPGRPTAPGGVGRPGQGPGGPEGRGGQRRGMTLAAIPVSVMDLVTPLKADQKKKITLIQDKMKADMKTATRETRGGLMTKATDDVKAILTPAQMASVQQALPTLGVLRRAIPMGAVDDLKLTKPQFTKMSGFATAVMTQFKGLQGPAMQTKMQQVGPQLKTQVEGVLTPTQKSALAKYVAAHPPRQFGGPGGAGGPGAAPSAASVR